MRGNLKLLESLSLSLLVVMKGLPTSVNMRVFCFFFLGYCDSLIWKVMVGCKNSIEPYYGYRANNLGNILIINVRLIKFVVDF